jgi:hypothetical protein
MCLALEGRCRKQSHMDVSKVFDIAAEMGFGKVLFDCFAVEGDLSVVERHN